MISYEEALELLKDQEAVITNTCNLRLGGWYTLPDDGPPQPGTDRDVRGLDLVLSESVRVTLLPNAVYILETSGDRSRDAKKRLDEFFASLMSPEHGRINESGGRWRLAD